MKLYHRIHLLIESQTQRAEFLELGLELPPGRRVPLGELVTFDIGEDDPRWKRIEEKIAPLRNHKAFDLLMTTPTLQEPKHSADWFVYSGESVEQLISLEGKYRTDSLVVAFEKALMQKAERGSLTEEERTVLAVEALEREVNNGGYDQFFENTPEYASVIVECLKRIGCEETASIAQKAVNAMGAPDKERKKVLRECDAAYFEGPEPIADRLFAFIKAKKARFKL